MTAASSPSVAGGPGVCFDTTTLIQFNDHNRLSLLERWFGTAYTATVIIDEELADVVTYPQNQRIRAAAWLHAVPVDWADGHRLVRYLREERWGSLHNKDYGEAEVIALCRRHGWLAVIEDYHGRLAARECGVRSVRTLSVIAAAAACELIAVDDAWKLHVTLERHRLRADLEPAERHRPVFEQVVALLVLAWERNGRPGWPWVLTQPVDAAVLHLRQKIAGR